MLKISIKIPSDPSTTTNDLISLITTTDEEGKFDTSINSYQT